MVKIFGAPVTGRHAWKRYTVNGLCVFLVFLLVFLTACAPQPVPVLSSASPTQLILLTSTPTPLPTYTTEPSLTATLAPTPTLTATAVPDLQAILNNYTTQIPTGHWGVYIENLKTGQVASFQADDELHPASTVKTYLSVALLYWLDRHPDVTLTDKPDWDSSRTYQEILEATLAGTDEITTGEIYRFLNNQADYNAFVLARQWGAKHTMFGPRQSTASDLGLLLKRLYQKEVLSDKSRQVFFTILNSPDRKLSPVNQGIPESQRGYLIEKNSNVFTESLNIMADTALFSRDDCAYTITILTNKVEPLMKDQASDLIKSISQSAFSAYCGMPSGENIPTATPEPSLSPTLMSTDTPTSTFTPIPPTPTFTITPTPRLSSTPTPDTPLTREVDRLMKQIPSGISGAYLKNLKTGDFISVRGNDSFHIASTIKVFVGVAFFAWLDKHPEVSLQMVPDWDTRSYQDLLYAMLVESDESVTAGFYNMLDNYPGFNVYNLAKNWGAVHTDIGHQHFLRIHSLSKSYQTPAHKQVEKQPYCPILESNKLFTLILS